MRKNTTTNDQNSKLSVDHPIFEIHMVDRNQLAKMISLSPSYISRLMAEESLPHYKIGKSVRFIIKEVMAFLNERKRP